MCVDLFPVNCQLCRMPKAILLFDKLSAVEQTSNPRRANTAAKNRTRTWSCLGLCWRYHNFTRQAVFMFCPGLAWLSECHAAHKSKLNAFLSGSSSSKRNLQHVVTREGERERERKGTRRVATVQININHCVIIFCCQLNLSKVFIIHKCKTTFDKSFRPRSAPDKVRDRDRERNSRRAAYLSCVCLRQLLLGPNSNTHLRLPLLHP